MRNRTTRLPLAFFESSECYCCFLGAINLIALYLQLPYRGCAANGGRNSLNDVGFCSSFYSDNGKNDQTRKLFQVSQIVGRRFRFGLQSTYVRLYYFPNIATKEDCSALEKINVIAGNAGFQTCDFYFLLDLTGKKRLSTKIICAMRDNPFTYEVEREEVREHVKTLSKTLQPFVDFDSLESTYYGEIHISSEVSTVTEYFRTVPTIDSAV